MVMVGDFVTRKSYNNDIVFKVIDIEGDIYYLCGVSIRLFADSFLDCSRRFTYFTDCCSCTLCYQEKEDCKCRLICISFAKE